MSDLSDKLDSMVIRTTSPDGQIMATLTNLRSVSISFRSQSFKGYTASRLEQQLASVLTTVWTTRRTAVNDLFETRAGMPRTKEEWDANRRRYKDEVDRLELRGVSMGEVIKVRSVGMASFECRIKPGGLDSLDESTFVNEFNSMLQSLEADRRNRTAQLKDKYFDMKRGGSITIGMPKRPN